jgi:pimeloyl-ACP methyl ester carboxylesterase
MFVWSDADKYILRKAAQSCERYVSGDYRFEALHGVSHWMPDEQPDTVAGLLLEWFTSHDRYL